MSFESTLSHQGEFCIVNLIGRLDSATSAQFEKTLQNLFDQPDRRVLMDFSALDYVSSAGLRVIIMAAKRAKQSGGRMLLCSLQPHVRSVFEISGFLKILEVADTIELAQAQFA